jgi:hypothetical protein
MVQKQADNHTASTARQTTRLEMNVNDYDTAEEARAPLVFQATSQKRKKKKKKLENLRRRQKRK